ncbi:MAG: Uma2 family endonuclease [Oceanospirillaceae bacterium]|nr:Uma2 family endonuclease [Oceanospirillaceae bacterium]
MSTVTRSNAISEEDYLAGELVSDVRHELIDGEIYAMSGAKVTHNRISGNIFGEIRTQLKMSNCDAFTADMKVKAGANYFYPDVLVDCSELDGEALFADSPSVIFEVLSRSTRKMDETVKKIAYLNILTLEEYILVEQDFVDVEVFRKSDDWRSTHYFLGDQIHLDSVAVKLDVEEIYARVKNQDMLEWVEARKLEN